MTKPRIPGWARKIILILVPSASLLTGSLEAETHIKERHAETQQYGGITDPPEMVAASNQQSGRCILHLWNRAECSTSA